MKYIQLHIFFWALLWVSLPTYGQEKASSIPLKEAIDQLETTFNHTFNYTESTISNVTVTPPDPKRSLVETLNFFEKETQLSFKIIGNNVVSVSAAVGIQICGYLKNSTSLEAVVSATVQGTKNSVVTDKSGYFSLYVSSSSEMITVRHLGYQTIVSPAATFASANCPVVYVSPQTERLQEVLLTSFLVQGMSKLSNGGQQIDFTTFTALPGLIETDVLQSVQALPGVQSTNETVSNITIRGGTNDQNLVLWDDIKMYQTGHFFGLISAFNPQITQKVTVQKNGTEASFSDGVSGSIKMETEAEINTDFTASFGATLIDTNVFLDVPLGETSSLQIGGRKSLSDIVVTPTYETYFTRISQDTEVETNEGPVRNTDKTFDFYDISMRWLYKISDRDKLRVNFLYLDNNLVFNENITIDAMTTSRESSVAQNSLGAGVWYEHQWSNVLSTSFQIYESDYNLRAINANILDAQRFLQENSVSETGVQTETKYSISDRVKLSFGYELIETKVTNLDDVDVPLVRTLISEVVRTHSGFGQYALQSKSLKSALVLGFRYNYLDKFNKSILEPRLQFTHRIVDELSLEVAGEFKHQITSQIINFQSDFLGIEKRRWQLSNNENIPILKSKQISAGLNYDKQGWLFSLEGYYKKVDGITSQAQGFQNQFEFVKTSGSYDAVGADVLLRKRLQHLSFWLSYSFLRSDYTFDELAEKTFPSNYNIPHSLTFGSVFVYEDLKFTAGLNWRSGNPTTTPVEGSEIVDGEINYGPTNAERLQDYFRVDSAALYQFTLGTAKAEAGLSVWNLFNQTNTIGVFYRINSEGNVVANTQNALGITPNAMLRVTL